MKNFSPKKMDTLNVARFDRSLLLSRKSRRKSRRKALARGLGAAALAAAMATGSLQAGTVYWDTSTSAGLGGTATWGTTFTTNVSGNVALTTVGTTDDAIFQGTAGTVTLGAAQTVNSLTFNTTGYTLTTSGVVTRVLTGSITLANNVTLNISPIAAAAIEFNKAITGGTGSAINVGGTNSASGDATRINLNTGGSIDATPISITTAGNIGISGFVSNGGTRTISGTITNNTGVLTMLGATSGNKLNVNGVVSGSAGVRFSAGSSGGAGNIVLGAAGIYTGDTQFNGSSPNGVVTLGIDNGISTVSNVIMGFSNTNGQNFDLNGFNQTIASLAQGNSGGTGKITNSGSGTATATLTINGTSSTSFGLIIEDGASRKIALARGGSGTTTLTNTTNTYTGGTSISGGVLDIAGDGTLGAVPGSATTNITIDGGRLQSGATFALSSNRGIALGATAGTSIAPTGSSVLTYGGVMADKPSSTGILVKQGGGTLALGGVSTYSGDTSINNGIVQLTTGNNRLPTGTTLNIGQAASTNLGTLDLNGFSQQVAGLVSTSGINNTASKNTITSTSAATLTLGGSGTYAFGAATQANSGIIAGSIALTKSGSGTQTLGDVNTYSGNTNITGGVLAIASTGTINNTNSLIINGSTAEFKYNNTTTAFSRPITFTQGKISGTGTIGVAVTSGANTILSPGNSPGIQPYTAGLTLNDGGTYQWEINNWTGTTAGTDFDQIQITNANLNISALTTGAFPTHRYQIDITSLTGSNVAGNVQNFNASTPRSWIIATTPGLTGSFNSNLFSLSTTNFSNNLSGGSFSLNFTGNNLVLSFDPAATGNNSQITINAGVLGVGGASTKTIDFGRVLASGSQTTGTQTFTKTGTNDAPYTVAITPGGNITSTTFTGSGTLTTVSPSATGTITLDTSTVGSKTGTVTIDNTAADHSVAGTGDLDGNDVFTVTATAVNQRTFSTSNGGAISLGRFMGAFTPTGSIGVTSTGTNDVTANATVSGFSGTGTNGLTLTLSNGSNVFNGAASQTATYTIGSTASTGTISGSFSSNVAAELGSIAPVIVNVTGTSVANRVVTASAITLANPVLLHGTASGSTNLSTTGDNNHFTSVKVAGQDFNAANSVGSTNVSHTFNSYGSVNETTPLTTTSNENLTGETPINVAVSFIATVGNALADKSGHLNSITHLPDTFGQALSSTVQGGGAYDGLESTVIGTSGSGAGTLVGGAFHTTATILDGNSPSDQTVTMAWRTRIGSETNLLVSDVVDLGGIPQGTMYVLQMSFDPATAEALNEHILFLGWLNPANGLWQRATSGNSDGGLSAHYVDGAYNSAADFHLGYYGTDGTSVWAVVDHASQFAVIPAPASLPGGLMLLSIVGLISRCKRR